jgi:aspartate kinase
VFKFGGSSLANVERIDHVANLIKDQIKEGFRPRAVVCSAMGKTTNNLLLAGEFALGTEWTPVLASTDHCL